MIKEKIQQAIKILNERKIDLWLIFVRESHTIKDPCLPLILGAHCTWQSAFLISKTGQTVAIVGNFDQQSIKDCGAYEKVIGYQTSIREDLVREISWLNPQQIAINFSTNDFMSDGLTHGMYLLLLDYLKSTPFGDQLISAEDIMSAVRGRKSATEIQRLKKAVDITIEIFDSLSQFLKPGKTEKEIADFVLAQVKRKGVALAWDEAHCPAVFTGPDTAGAHYGPTNRKTEAGHIMNMDFGVRINDYVSDLQRTWYFLRKGEQKAPPPVVKAFGTIGEAISKAAAILKPGVEGWEVDKVAREYIVSQGYEEYPHGLGHQVGREAHDGAGGLFPKWEKYGQLPFAKVEAGQVYTIEPRLCCKNYGIVTIEEEVVVTENGCEFLSPRQQDLFYVDYVN